MCAFVCQLRASFTSFGQLLCCAHKRIVNIMKVYTEKNNMQVELIRFRKTYRLENIDFGNFEVGIYFPTEMFMKLRDVSPLFCACSKMCLFDKRQFDSNHVLIFTPFQTV